MLFSSRPVFAVYSICSAYHGQKLVTDYYLAAIVFEVLQSMNGKRGQKKYDLVVISYTVKTLKAWDLGSGVAIGGFGKLCVPSYTPESTCMA